MKEGSTIAFRIWIVIYWACTALVAFQLGSSGADVVTAFILRFSGLKERVYAGAFFDFIPTLLAVDHSLIKLTGPFLFIGFLFISWRFRPSSRHF